MKEQNRCTNEFDPLRVFASLWMQPVFTACRYMTQTAGEKEGAPQETSGEGGEGERKGSHPAAPDVWGQMLELVNSFQANGTLNQSMGRIWSLGMKSVQIMVQESMNMFHPASSDLNRFFAEGGSLHSLENLMSVYEQRVCQILNIPQLGLTRQYQERMAQAVDELNHFFVSMVDFSRVFALPVKKAFEDVGKRLSEASEDADFRKDPQAFYKLWLQYLEQHYLNLFHSPEFMSVLHRLLNRYADSWDMQQSVLKDFLKVLPVSTKDEFDELARDNYLLNKELKALKKTVRSLEEQIREQTADPASAKQGAWSQKAS